MVVLKIEEKMVLSVLVIAQTIDGQWTWWIAGKLYFQKPFTTSNLLHDRLTLCWLYGREQSKDHFHSMKRFALMLYNKTIKPNDATISILEARQNYLQVENEISQFNDVLSTLFFF